MASARGARLTRFPPRAHARAQSGPASARSPSSTASTSSTPTRSAGGSVSASSPTAGSTGGPRNSRTCVGRPSLLERGTERLTERGREEQVCYSWWAIASLAILGRSHWVDGAKLSHFILSAQVRSANRLCRVGALSTDKTRDTQDPDKGGIADRPEDVADVWHTVFGLAGASSLSVLSIRPHAHRSATSRPLAPRLPRLAAGRPRVLHAASRYRQAAQEVSARRNEQSSDLWRASRNVVVNLSVSPSLPCPVMTVPRGG